MTLTFLPPAPIPAESLFEMPCQECGLPSVGWVTSETFEDGMDTYTCYSVCNDHIPEGVKEA